jgi:hypothetical protein
MLLQRMDGYRLLQLAMYRFNTGMILPVEMVIKAGDDVASFNRIRGSCFTFWIFLTRVKI